MSTTLVNSATLSDLIPIRVQEKLISVMAEREGIYSTLMGSGESSIIQIVNDLKKAKGDQVKVHLGVKLSGEGVDSDNTLEGSEEAMNFYSDALYIDQKRHGIRLDGVMTEQRSAINLREQAGPRLGTWAREWLTEVLTCYLYGSRGVRTGMILPTTFTGFAGNSIQAPDTSHQLIAGTAGTKIGMAATDRMTTALLTKAVRNIKLLINSGAAMRPAKVNGKSYFIALLTPEQIYDLRQDSNWVNAQQYANVRGNENPLFQDAEGTWNGLIIKENDHGVLFNDYGAGSNVAAARAVILGAQAATIAFGNSGGTDAADGRWKYKEKGFDYDNQTGFAISTVLGCKKLRFNSRDYGVYSIDTGYTA